MSEEPLVTETNANVPPEPLGDATRVIEHQKKMFEIAQEDKASFMSTVVEQDGEQLKATVSAAHFTGTNVLFFIQWLADQYNLSIAAVVTAIESKRKGEETKPL